MDDAQKIDALFDICDSMLTDYLVCAKDKCIYSGRIDPFANDNRPILEKIDGTRDGMRIRHYIEQLHNLGAFDI